MTITVSNLNLYFDVKKMIKYNYSLNNNIITLNLPVENSIDKIKVNIEIDNINSFKVKKMFVSKQTNVKENILQLSNKK
tara:strand:- start:1570 stop:1806 length:237 start_codon:yes stop_codon:yes gene_type:complete